MRKTVVATVAVLAIGAVYLLAQAGNLEPPGSPASTMVTLQEIYDRVSASPVGIAKTGQTGCWDAAATSISCAGTGQDGEYQTGVLVDPRFTDNGDGTVQDNLTGLIWLKNANCFGLRNWTNALSDANTLADASCGLTDGSIAGDWRLPNVKELRSLVDFVQAGPPLTPGHPFSAVQSQRYWSSTSAAADPRYAWNVFFNGGHLFVDFKTTGQYVWPFRAGQ